MVLHSMFFLYSCCSFFITFYVKDQWGGHSECIIIVALVLSGLFFIYMSLHHKWSVTFCWGRFLYCGVAWLCIYIYICDFSLLTKKETSHRRKIFFIFLYEKLLSFNQQQATALHHYIKWKPVGEEFLQSSIFPSKPKLIVLKCDNNRFELKELVQIIYH